jgi:hypothetical protein
VWAAGDSFLTRSKKLFFAADGMGPVATTLREQKETIIVVSPEKEVTITLDGVSTCESQFEGCAGLAQRANDIDEFGIRSIHLIPVEGGVFEYGVSSEATLTDVTLDATIELECEAAGASYAIFWKEGADRVSTVAGSFQTPNYEDEVARSGFTVPYTQASEAFVPASAVLCQT